MNDKVVMPVWTFGLFIVLLNTTMFNVSIPSIIGDIGITADLGSWLISSYSIGYALSTVIYSRLSDAVPIRKLLTAGLLILGVSSVFGLFATTFQTLLAARIAQSAGAGAMAGLGLVLASRYVPSERRGRAISMISSGSALAFGLGPIIGGVITEFVGWNGLFGVTCFVLILLPFLFRIIPTEQRKPFKFDWTGSLLTIVNAVSLLTAISQRSLLWLAAGILSIAVHVRHLRRRKESFVNAELFGKPAYVKLLFVGFVVLFVNLGNLFLMPLALANLFDKSPLVIGFTIAPGAILSVFLTRFVGIWLDRYGNLPFLIIGQSVIVCVLILFRERLGASASVVLIGYLLFSPANSTCMASLNNETARILPPALIGSGMGFMQLIQFFGGSFSVAACGVLLEIEKRKSLEHAYEAVYGVLIAACACSLCVLLWYALTRTRAAVRSS